jgi:uncharacterized membrane protein YeaQ/YmgE (transglycosylase-associated protein family)
MLALIIGALLLGIIIGPLARLVLPGEQNISLGMTILLGALGALVGGIIYQALGGGETEGIDWVLHLVQVVVAAVAVIVYINMQGRRA